MIFFSHIEKRDNIQHTHNTMNQTKVKEQVLSISQQERIAFIIARQMLLEFFQTHMYSNNIELYNTRYEKDINHVPFANDEERMKYFISRFNEYYNDDTYEFALILPADAEDHQEKYPFGTDVARIISIKNAIIIIEEHLGIEHIHEPYQFL